MVRAKAYLIKDVELRWKCAPKLLAGDPSKKKPIVLCGHSQGGAVATIACAPE